MNSSSSVNKSSRNELDSENLMSCLKELSKFENRIAGTEQIKGASLFIKHFLEKLPGIKVWIDEFPIYTSYPLDSELIILSPSEKTIPSLPNLYSMNTAGEGITGEVVYVGPGGKEHYKEKDVKGKIVLAELSYAPPRPEKVKLAQDQGARAIVISNWGPPDNEIVGRGAIKRVWGPLTSSDVEKIPKITSLNISRKDAENLKRTLAKERVTMNVKCEVENKWVKSNQPVCRIVPSKKEFNELIIAGSHLEAWGGTVTDDSAGNAILLEIARKLSEKKNSDIKREIIMGFWDGHEIGEAAGSGWFVDHYWSELNERGLAYVNIDGCGMKETSDFISYSSPETWTFLDQVEEEILGKKSKKKLPLKIGDNSFLGIGIPYIFTFATYPEKQLEEMGNAIFGWFYHSEKDTFEQLDEELLKLQADLYYEYLVRLATDPVIPLDYELFASKIIGEIEEIKKIYSCIPGPDRLETILKKVEALMETARAINRVSKDYSEKYSSGFGEKDRSDVESLNKVLISLGRHLIPAFRSTVGKYSHDTYGYSVLAKPLPRVYRVLEEISIRESGGFEYNCLLTDLKREYNFLDDAISNAIYLTSTLQRKVLLG